MIRRQPTRSCENKEIKDGCEQSSKHHETRTRWFPSADVFALDKTCRDAITSGTGSVSKVGRSMVKSVQQRRKIQEKIQEDQLISDVFRST